jgi:hypothetical protein
MDGAGTPGAIRRPETIDGRSGAATRFAGIGASSKREAEKRRSTARVAMLARGAPALVGYLELQGREGA